MSTAYLNGSYLPLQACKVSVLDRGFIFGDAIYELIPVYNAQPFYLSAHLDRLARSLEQVQIVNPHDPAGWHEIIQALIAKSELEQLYVYIQVTRGVAARDHAFPADTPPTVFAMTGAWPHTSEAGFSTGLSAVTVADMRWDRCDIKVTGLLANVLKKQQAVENQAHEAIFIRDGYALEGSATNVFVVNNGQVNTAAKNNLILPGITRDIVVEIIHEIGLPLKEQAASEQQLRQASEIWISSSTKECLPVTTLDKKPVGDGRPGPLWQKIYSAFQTRK